MASTPFKGETKRGWVFRDTALIYFGGIFRKETFGGFPNALCLLRRLVLMPVTPTHLLWTSGKQGAGGWTSLRIRSWLVDESPRGWMNRHVAG